jgi:hypothetical protein
MNHLPKSHRPHSDDPDFWNVWIGQDAHGKEVSRPANWRPIVEDWTGASATAEVTPPAAPPPPPPPSVEPPAEDDDEVPF